MLLIGCSKDSDGDPTYLDANGVTITCDSGSIGDTFKVKGITYTIVDETLLREMVGNGEDVTTVCTSRVTDMIELFLESQFNQNLSGWNVDNVIDCSDFSNNTPQWVLPKPNFTNCDPN